jgi:hypothetical protein
MEHDASPTDPWGEATGIAVAAAEALRAHRQRMAVLVDGLDDLGRRAAGQASPDRSYDGDPRREQSTDARSARVIASLTDVLRAGDRELGRLTAELDRCHR